MLVDLFIGREQNDLVAGEWVRPHGNWDCVHRDLGHRGDAVCGAAQTTMNDAATDPDHPPRGKQIGSVSYFHRSVVDRLDRDLQLRIDEAQLHAGCLTWNVVKVRQDTPHRLSL